LEIAEKLKLKNVRVVTDNDGHPERVKGKYKKYLNNIFFDENTNAQSEDDPEKYNPNTLEPNILKANGLEKLNSILGKSFKKERKLKTYMKENKNKCALAIFESKENITYPKYIQDAIDFENQKQ
jgi:putative ATP-dependent endonuclease of OLD family